MCNFWSEVDCIHWLMLIPGNIDQAQYCERIKGIIELLGSKLSLDELSKIWKIQVSTSRILQHSSHMTK